jgi:17beta-estradiol 17-dehydrogenase / very-long-chain 3-oxoacyl-CoA reductase
MITWILSSIGLAVTFKVLFDIVAWLLHTKGGRDAAEFGGRGQGGWAVVTGCTSGIGEAYAHEAARLGFNVLLVSRTQAKLDAVQAEIASKVQKSGVELATRVFDFANAGEDEWRALVSDVEARDVGLLVNNVGVNFACPTLYLDTSVADNERIVDVNIRSVLRLTRAVLPNMVAKKRGAIVNLSSFTARIPVPMLSTYSASKAFVDFFSQALNVEYASSGIAIQSVCPGFVSSNMTGMRAGGMVATASAVARQSLGRLGQRRTQPFWIHAVIEYVMRNLPWSIVSSYVAKQNLAANRRWHRKYGAQSKSD